MTALWRRGFNIEPLKANKKATAAVAFFMLSFYGVYVRWP